MSRGVTVHLSKEKALADRGWKIVSADGVPLGRLASQVAAILRGKDKATFSPHVDTGDFVIITDANKVKLTGSKPETKLYRHHTTFVGGLKEIRADRMLREKPGTAIRRAVWGMLPKGPLGRRMIAKLKIYAGSEHPHAAQRPEKMELVGIPQ